MDETKLQISIDSVLREWKQKYLLIAEEREQNLQLNAL